MSACGFAAALFMAFVAQTAADNVTLPGSGAMAFGPISITGVGSYGYDFQVVDGVNVDIFEFDETAYQNYRNAVLNHGSFDLNQQGIRRSWINVRSADRSAPLVVGGGNIYVVIDNTPIATRTFFSSTTVTYTVSGITLNNGAFTASSEDSSSTAEPSCRTVLPVVGAAIALLAH